MEFDYANNAAGAKILASSDGLTGSSNVLKPDPTNYMLAPCETERTWFVVGLTEYISLERVGFISLEFFASQFRHIQILGSSTYPAERWRVLGEVELSIRETHQVFNVEPRCRKQEHGCWVRFLKIRILSQYTFDNSVYCALTKIQVGRAEEDGGAIWVVVCFDVVPAIFGKIFCDLWDMGFRHLKEIAARLVCAQVLPRCVGREISFVAADVVGSGVLWERRLLLPLRRTLSSPPCAVHERQRHDTRLAVFHWMAGRSSSRFIVVV